MTNARIELNTIFPTFLPIPFSYGSARSTLRFWLNSQILPSALSVVRLTLGHPQTRKLTNNWLEMRRRPSRKEILIQRIPGKAGNGSNEESTYDEDSPDSERSC